MAQIETKSGFVTEVDENAVDDMEFLDLLCRLEDGDPRARRGICEKLIGKDGTLKLFDHVRTESGRVPVTAVDREITDIINGLKNAKK